MRRAVFGLLGLAAALIVLTSVSCQRTDSLRIVSVNNGEPVFADLTDWGIYRDPEEGEVIPFYVIPDEVVQIEVSYVEIGPGLPTWTPYEVRISKATIKYTFVDGEDPGPIEKVTSTANIIALSDPTGEKTVVGTVVIVPSLTKEEYFGGGGDPTESSTIAAFTAELALEGTDLASGQTVKAETEVQVNIGEYYDDPSRIGQ